MTREAEQRELRLRDDIEKLRIQQEQTLETLDTKIVAMMERRTQAIMNRLDGLLGNRSGSRNGETKSGEPDREPRINFNEQTNRRRAYGSTRGRGSSSSYATGDTRPRGQTSGEVRLATDRPQTNADARHTCDWRRDSRNWSHANQGRSHPSDSDRRENPEPLSGGNDAQAGHSRYATPMATAFEPLKRSMKTILIRLSRSNERSKNPEGFLRKQDAIKMNLMAVLIPG